jgi:hypothetical protein
MSSTVMALVKINDIKYITTILIRPNMRFRKSFFSSQIIGKVVSAVKMVDM